MEKAKLTEKQKFWQAHIEAQARSGVTRRQYCETHSLAMQQMSYYASYLKSKARSDFIKVPLAEAAALPQHMTIRLAGGISIECPPDVRLVSEVLRSIH